MLYDRYANKVFAKCVSFTKDRQQAEDLAHDIFLKVYLKLGDFRFESKFSTWLYSITYHECMEFKRKETREHEQEEAYALEQRYDDDGDEAALLALKVNQLKRLLDQINPEDKAVLLMKYQDNLPIREIMELTGSGESAIKMRLKRAKSKIVALAKDLIVMTSLYGLLNFWR